MPSAPFDTNDPAVHDFLALVRLQILTPLSLLLNVAALLVAAFVAEPSIGAVARLHPTAITPHPAAIAPYVLVIFLGQLGYCLLLAFARKEETKTTLVKGVGLSLVGANVVMAMWTIAWVTQHFLTATILLGILLLLLAYANIALISYHPPTGERPLDTALIHAPLRFFFVLPLLILFPLSLFIALGFTHTPTHPKSERWHAYPAFGIILSTNLVGLILVAVRRDIVWCIAATWACVSLWALRPKPVLIEVPAIAFTALYPIVLVAACGHSYFWRKRRERRIVLDGDDARLYESRIRHAEEESERAPREVEGW